MKELPHRKEHYSLSAQTTRDEVIGAHKTFFALRKSGDEKARPPGFRKKIHVQICGITMDMGLK